MEEMADSSSRSRAAVALFSTTAIVFSGVFSADLAAIILNIIDFPVDVYFKLKLMKRRGIVKRRRARRFAFRFCFWQRTQGSLVLRQLGSAGWTLAVQGE
jgi:hypothetical protein